MVGTITVAEAGGGEDEAATPEEDEEGEATAAASPEQAGGGAMSVDVEAGDIYFEPSEFEIAPGGTIKMHNAGQLEHDMAVDDWGGIIIDVLNAGEEGEYTVPEDATPGDSFEFYCTIPGHKEAGMVGTLTIAEAGGGDEGAAESTPEEAAAAGGGGGGAASSVDIEAGDIYYEPTEFEIAPGGTIKMHNAGQLEHDFAVDEWGGEVISVLGSGEEGEYTVPEDAKPGDSFEFYCTIPGHKEAGMVGKLIVE